MEVRSFNKDMIEKHEDSRDKVITRTSIVGIVANLFLSAFKAVIGFLSHSIAIAGKRRFKVFLMFLTVFCKWL